MSAGEVRFDGAYWRNLKTVLRLHGRDDTVEFGYTYKFQKWYWKPDGLSVSCTDCTCECCSLTLAGPNSADHVVRIDLKAFSVLVGETMLARYEPEEEDPKNPCHFLLIPDESPVEVTQTLLSDLRERFKNSQKRPSTPDEREAAAAMQQELDRVFDLHLGVRERISTRAGADPVKNSEPEHAKSELAGERTANEPGTGRPDKLSHGLSELGPTPRSSSRTQEAEATGADTGEESADSLPAPGGVFGLSKSLVSLSRSLLSRARKRVRDLFRL